MFVEKPITLNLDDSLKLIDWAKYKQEIQIVGHLFKYKKFRFKGGEWPWHVSLLYHTRYYHS